MSLTQSPGPTGLRLDDLWALTIDQYHVMIDQGILGEDDPVELLEGRLVGKMAKSKLHEVVLGLTADRLSEAGPGWHVRSQSPATLADSEPEPDIAVVRGRRLDYLEHHPGAEGIGLLVEVSDSSPARDEGWKLQIYAAAGVKEYWVVDLRRRRLRAYSEPDQAHRSYGVMREYGPEQVVSLVLPGSAEVRVALDEILPPPSRGHVRI